MRRCLSLLSLPVLAGSSFGNSAYASAISIPDAYYTITFGGIPGSADVNRASSPQSGSYSFHGGTLDVSASASNTTQPAAYANLTSGGCTSGYSGSGCAGGSYGATSLVGYYFEILSGSNTVVPVFFDTAGGVSVSGMYGSAYVTVSLNPHTGDPLVPRFTAATYNAYTYGGTACGADGCVVSTQFASLLTNTIYNIEVYASAAASTNSAATISAWADPHIYVDPSFVGAGPFSLLTSPGVGNTTASPVPGPVVGAGVPGLIMAFGGILAWRRRRAA